MNEYELFKLGLQLTPPWKIENIWMEEEGKKASLHIKIDHDFKANAQFDGKKYSIYDHQERVWQHLNFFQYNCFIHARVPRVKLEDGSIKLIQVPWADKHSRFTLLFEQFVLEFIKGGMSLAKAGNLFQIEGKRIFRIIKKYVDNALKRQPLQSVKHLSVDETSLRKGHHYITVLCDREHKQVVGLAEGKHAEAVANAIELFTQRGAKPEDVRTVTLDMSPAFIKAVTDYFENATMIFDRFHIMKELNSIVDQVRREEQSKAKSELKRSRYVFLRNANSLSIKQKQQLEVWTENFPKLGLIHRLKEMFKLIFDYAKINSNLTPLNQWIKQALQSGIPQLNAFVNLLHNHWYGIKSYFKTLATNSYAENVNLKIQEIKRIGRGYRNISNFKTLIYFHLGKLKLY